MSGILIPNESYAVKPPVLSKRDFVRRYRAGEFGNASPTWDTAEEWWRSNQRCHTHALFHIRNRVKGGATFYNVPAHSMGVMWARARAKCGGAQNLYVSAMAPTEKTLIQGEVQQGLFGLDLTYTRVKKPMRDALLESSESVRGLTASLLLATGMNQRSYEWLEYLLQAYPNHVVEFSVYSVEWGTVPGYNTVFWEVRRY